MTTTTISKEQLSAIVSAAVMAALEAMNGEAAPKPKAAKVAKVEAEMAAKAKKSAKVEAVKSKHDAILDSKRVERMVDTAVKRAESQGFEVKSSKQGKWVWLYPCGKSSGQGRTPEFKSLKLAKGWKYSPKRAAFYRDFS